ncbi:hypothetical protein [Pragia fontium]|uniref:Uncharacterized protein n=2 Tax=Pragia fontium TaxID=82985 RepID=A0AAJ4W914_9GAMM|nr:hypothetical protein [Pragia fontium]AKJ41896.1 hypothetical protein QQ39_07215 [Pragia fontium]GKX62080.1 hypothetical protein SOASR032_06490 [Pragia fontium]SFC39767.1 hypothetical protein SAMN02745723_102264 [Pragia fontium DSM 5563 = ATCC 49100]VEJ54779.1 Uncharacterised protein [Pragia fontium]
MTGRPKINDQQALFLQRNIYQHLHNTVLQAALTGMDEVTTSRTVVQKIVQQMVDDKVSASIQTNPGRSPR